MSTPSAHCGELSARGDMAHSRTSGASRAAASGLPQYAELIPAAGGFQPIERGQALGEIERLPQKARPALRGRRRPGKEIPLCIGAAELAQLLELLPAFDAFRNHLDVQVPCHVYDGAHDGEIAQVRHQVTHETTVDLERIPPPALQVREARVSNAEIIDGDAHA